MALGTYGGGSNPGAAGLQKGIPATKNKNVSGKVVSTLKGKGKNAKLKALAKKRATGGNTKKPRPASPFKSEAADKAEDKRDKAKT